MTSDESPAGADPAGEAGLSDLRCKRPALWLLIIPAVLYCLTPIVANRIEPMVFGVPFIIFYTAAVTVATWVVIWLVARLDPLYRAGAVEPVPVDIAFGDVKDERAKQ